MKRRYKLMGVVLSISVCVGIALLVSVNTPTHAKGQTFIVETMLPKTNISTIGYIEEIHINREKALMLGEMFGFEENSLTYSSEEEYLWKDNAGGILKISNKTGHIRFSTEEMSKPHEDIPTENESISIAKAYVEEIRGKTTDLIVEYADTLYMVTESKNGTTISEEPLSICIKFRQIINNHRVVCGGGILINIGTNGTLLGYTQYTVQAKEFLNVTIIDSQKGLEKIKEKGVTVGGKKPNCKVTNVTLVYYYNPFDKVHVLHPAWEYTLLPTGVESKPIRTYVGGVSGEVII
ncbi:MAG: hypothetical protein QMC80_05685 [Thermoplasmatales archaeon]|nr:hypothetical protein [Thermoplasmatales archaeon]